MREPCYEELIQMWRLQAAGRIGLPDLGKAQNNLGAEAVVRQMGRGQILDKHMGETGLAVRMAPGSSQTDLLRLSALNRTNPARCSVLIDVQEESPAVVPGTADHRLHVVIAWGTGKGQSSAVVDARHGAQIALTANIIQCSVRYLGSSGPTVLVSASVAYGERPGGVTAVTFTEEATPTLDAGALSAFYRIPKYAARVEWVSPNDPGVFVPPAATLAFTTASVFGTPVVSRVAPPSDTLVTLPNGADFVQLRNDSVDGTSYRLIYEIIL